MKKVAIILALVFFITSCATIDQRYTGKRIIVEKARYDDSYVDDYYYDYVPYSYRYRPYYYSPFFWMGFYWWDPYFYWYPFNYYGLYSYYYGYYPGYYYYGGSPYYSYYYRYGRTSATKSMLKAECPGESPRVRSVELPEDQGAQGKQEPQCPDQGCHRDQELHGAAARAEDQAEDQAAQSGRRIRLRINIR